MVKLGRLIQPYHQLCYAHGLQLGILDVIYKKAAESVVLDTEDSETHMDAMDNESSEGEEDDETNDHDPAGFVVKITRSEEAEISPEYGYLIRKVRKIVCLFRKSPLKNETLQNYVRKEYGKELQLVLDCRTRWNSLSDMISSFNKLKLSICKALIDLGLGSNPQFCFTEEEFSVLKDLDNIFQPVKLAVEVLCRQDATLLTAETTLKFMIRKLEELKKPLAQEMALSMRQRISQRRTPMTAVLMYLHNPTKYAFLEDDTFGLPAKYELRHELKKLVERLFRNEEQNCENNRTLNLLVSSDEDDDNLPLASIAIAKPHTNQKVISLQEELELSLTSENILCGSPAAPAVQLPNQSFDVIIKKEMALFESGGSRGKYLELAYVCLKSVTPTSVEAERAFSAAGYLVNDIRSSLSDNSVNMLCFLRKYFQQSQ